MAGPQCCESPPPRNHPPVGVGRLESFHDLTAYVTGSSDATAAVILISDVFGYEAPIFRKLADKVAEAGYFVVVPDYFNGDPYVPDQSNIQDWLKNHAPEKGVEDSVKIIEVLKSRGTTSIGAGGFCWGAKVVVELAKGEDLKAGVLLHPSRVTVDDIKAVKVPLAILGAEIDRSSPPELVKQFEVILSEKSEGRRRLTSFQWILCGEGTHSCLPLKLYKILLSNCCVKVHMGCSTKRKQIILKATNTTFCYLVQSILKICLLRSRYNN